MALLNAEIQKQVREMFAVMDAPVTLVFFTQGKDASGAVTCPMCADTQGLLEELAALSDKISLEVHDFLQDAQAVKEYAIDKVPALAVVQGPDNRDFGIRFYGIPSGYEFGSVIQDIVMVSQNKAGLNAKTMKAISQLKEPVHIQVYSTPT